MNTGHIAPAYLQLAAREYIETWGLRVAGERLRLNPITLSRIAGGCVHVLRNSMIAFAVARGLRIPTDADLDT